MPSDDLDPGERVPSDAVVRDDTTELRWFADGPVPPLIVAWFTRDGAIGVVEERVDTYRVDRRHDAGVKRRFQTTLELKIRRSTGERHALGEHLTAPIEEWRRWSPAGHLVETERGSAWIDVGKRVYKRRFTLEGREVPWTNTLPPPGEAGCDVEVASVAAGATAAWTFALAAFGPEAHRRTALDTAWQAIVSEAPVPEGFEQDLVHACGYPEWLAEVTAARSHAPVDVSEESPSEGSRAAPPRVEQGPGAGSSSTSSVIRPGCGC